MRALLILVGLAALVVVALLSLGLLKLNTTAGSLPSVSVQGGAAHSFIQLILSCSSTLRLALYAALRCTALASTLMPCAHDCLVPANLTEPYHTMPYQTNTIPDQLSYLPVPYSE